MDPSALRIEFEKQLKDKEGDMKQGEDELKKMKEDLKSLQTDCEKKTQAHKTAKRQVETSDGPQEPTTPATEE